MERSIDVKEIYDFIRSGEYESTGSKNDFSIGMITEDIDEAYLRTRAKELKAAYELDEDFKDAVRSLDIICNSEKQTCNECTIRKYCNHYIAKKRSEVDENSLKMIDLFCGAGGLSLGFTQEGFITTLANDIEECCVDTYAHNHPETPRDHIILGDVREVADNIQNLVHDEVSVVCGGPPCQGFSEANRQRLIDDPRNKLYKNFVKIVDKVRPKFFVMENVKGMMTVKNQVIEDFNNVGYQVSAHVLNAKDFGVPQNRERLIYIGNRIGVDNELVFAAIDEYSKTIPNYYLKDAIYGLRELKASTVRNATEIDSEESGRKIERNNGESNAYIDLINQGRKSPVMANHKARYNNDRDIEIFGLMEPGDKSDDPKIQHIMPYKSRSDIFKDKYYKLVPDNVSKTITAHMKFDCNMYIHPSQARGLTPREAARIQSYPDDYYFRGAYTKTYMQIGNSVPPLLGRAIAIAVKKYIK